MCADPYTSSVVLLPLGPTNNYAAQVHLPLCMLWTAGAFQHGICRCMMVAYC